MNRAQRKLRLEGVLVSRAQALEGLGDPATWARDAEEMEQKAKTPYSKPSKRKKLKARATESIPVKSE